jgi:tRNA (Thr-GGU) A37 N-methylase
VKLLKIEGNILEIENVDVIDQTPLLDLKPYVPYFDRPEGVRAGWIDRVSGDIKSKRSDERFS